MAGRAAAGSRGGDRPGRGHVAGRHRVPGRVALPPHRPDLRAAVHRVAHLLQLVGPDLSHREPVRPLRGAALARARGRRLLGRRAPSRPGAAARRALRLAAPAHARRRGGHLLHRRRGQAALGRARVVRRRRAASHNRGRQHAQGGAGQPALTDGRAPARPGVAVPRPGPADPGGRAGRAARAFRPPRRAGLDPRGDRVPPGRVRAHGHPVPVPAQRGGLRAVLRARARDRVGAPRVALDAALSWSRAARPAGGSATDSARRPRTRSPS